MTTHGHTNSGTPITDELVDEPADETEAGYDVDTIVARRGKRGRPGLGAEPRPSSPSDSTPNCRNDSVAGPSTTVSPSPTSSARRSCTTSKRSKQAERCPSLTRSDQRNATVVLPTIFLGGHAGTSAGGAGRPRRTPSRRVTPGAVLRPAG